MEPTQWLTLIGILLGAGGIGTAAITSWTTRRVESAKNKAVDNQNKLDAQRLKLEGWEQLVASLQNELTRRAAVHAAEIATKDARIAALAGRVAELEASIRPTTRKKDS